MPTYTFAEISDRIQDLQKRAKISPKRFLYPEVLEIDIKTAFDLGGELQIVDYFFDYVTLKDVKEKTSNYNKLGVIYHGTAQSLFFYNAEQAQQSEPIPTSQKSLF